MNMALRAKAILTDPLVEWETIEQETGDPAFVLTRYVALPVWPGKYELQT